MAELPPDTATHYASGREGLHVGGEWRTPDDHTEVTDLTDGERFARVAAAPADVDDAFAAAERAESTLRETTVVRRAEWLSAVAEGIEARADVPAEVIVREAGKPVASARNEVEAAAGRFRRAVKEVRSLDGDYLEGTTEGHEG